MKKNIKDKKGAGPLARAHVYYAGRVQGVGFRHTAEGTGHRAGVTGWVKNLRDGRVEVVCEGPKPKIEAFLDDLRNGPLGRHIREADCRWEEATGEFDDFTVEFDL